VAIYQDYGPIAQTAKAAFVPIAGILELVLILLYVLLVPLLARVRGIAYLRASAVAVLAVYPCFLLVEPVEVKIALLALLGLLNSGWYAIPKAGLYSALPGRSGTALAIGSVTGLVGSLLPITLGLLAERFGLEATMWLLLAGPLALLVGLPRRRP
jgi:FSR family fosmidomycin resistance protein-like MFS transporter